MRYFIGGSSVEESRDCSSWETTRRSLQVFLKVRVSGVSSYSLLFSILSQFHFVRENRTKLQK